MATQAFEDHFKHSMAEKGIPRLKDILDIQTTNLNIYTAMANVNNKMKDSHPQQDIFQAVSFGITTGTGLRAAGS